MKIIATYDKITKQYSSPEVYINRAQAVRKLRQAAEEEVNIKGTNFIHNDVEMYEIGEYDYESGTIKSKMQEKIYWQEGDLLSKDEVKNE